MTHATKSQLKIAGVFLLVAIIVGLVNECKAQELPLKLKSTREVFEFAETFKNDSIKVDSTGTRRLAITLYSKQTLDLSFAKSKEGDKVIYLLTRIDGSNGSLFNIWKHFVDPNADKESITSKGGTFALVDLDGKKKRVQLHATGKNWQISVL